MAIGTAYIKIMPEAKGISGQIGGLVDPAAESAGKSSGSKYIGALKKVIAVAGIGKFVGDSLKAGADLEQSIGGIETLYKGASDKMQQYASQAYKTAGVDANTYMQQVTSYSAGLISSMGGDVDAAADVANMAMIDMADNANKLGTPIENIQNAYQGFAKQNYTMLDNLKLGYGGTKSEMERLLADAEKFSGVHYDINNLDDVYNAIHVVQKEMDITGTTAKEASSTISGSLGMWKASWKDLIGNLALGNDIYPQMEALVSSSISVLKNILPAVGNILTGIPKMFSDHWPEIQTALGNAFTNALAFIKGRLPAMLESVLNGVYNIGMSIFKNVPIIVSKNWPLIKTAVSNLVTKISTFMKTKWPAFRDAALKLFVKIGTTIIKNIPMIINKVRQLISKLVTFVTQNSGKIWGAVKKLIGVLIKNLPGILKSLFKLAVTLVKSGIKLAWSAAKGIFKTVLTGVGTFAKDIISKLKSGLSKVADTMTKPFRNAWEKIKGVIDKVKGFFPLSVGKIFSNLKIPHINVKGGSPPFGIGGFGKAPKISVDWYRKAENQPYMFSRATLFGAGERNDEILYGRKQLMEDISNATNGGQIVINLNYDASTDAQEMVADIARGLKRYRMAGAF